MEEPLLDISNLKTYFYTEDGVVRAIDNVDLKIFKGEVLGIVGESGCGKSTIALSILKLVPKPGRIVEGIIKYDGKNLLNIEEYEMRQIRGGKIAIIWQDPMSSLNPVFTIEDQMSEAISLHQNITDKDEILKIIINMLEKVGIPSPEKRAKQYPHEFSGGMRQRVMIAMALSCNPTLLIADEPTTSLDVTIQAQILDLMRNLKKEFNSAVLIITHNLGVVAEIADKVAVMYAGKIVEYTNVMTIFKKPLHPYTRALLDSIPRIDVSNQTLQSIPGVVPDLINPPVGCRFNTRCSKVSDICFKEEPSLNEVESNHYVSCHLTEKGRT